MPKKRILIGVFIVVFALVAVVLTQNIFPALTGLPETSTKKLFSGKYIRASHPEGWEIKEYDDEEGMFSKTGSTTSPTTYTGLTGIEILSPGGERVFSLRGVDGVGLIHICPVIAKFSDTRSDYADELIARSEHTGNGTPQVTALAESYFSFQLFDTDFRDINGQLYHDIEPANDTFEPACGPLQNVVTFEAGPSFTVSNPNSEVYNKSSVYKVEYVVDNLSSEERVELRQLLDSFKLAS